MQERAQRKAKLRLSNLDQSAGGLYVWNVAQKRLVRNGERDTWTLAELADGIPLDIPPQERVVLALSVASPELERP